MNENETRKNLIDEQLNLAGWKADTQNLNYKLGTRPTLGENIAIAEYPTSSGPADYILFCGLDAIATVEAKKDSKDVPGDLIQAKRYSKDFHCNCRTALHRRRTLAYQKFMLLIIYMHFMY